MTVTIYGDILFFVNAGMDYMIFWTTSFLLKKRVSPGKILVASCVLSFLCCGMLFLPWFYGIKQGIVSFLLLGGVIWWLYQPHNRKLFLKLLFFTYLTCFVMGGIANAFYSYRYQWLFWGEELGQGRYPLWLLAVSTVSFYFGLRVVSPWLESHLINKQKYCSLRVRWKDKEIPLQLLIDTGNMLERTKEGEEIFIASFSSIQNFFQKELRQYYLIEGYQEETKFMEQLASVLEAPKKIPFSSLGKAEGHLLAFQADCVIFEKDNEEIEKSHVYIGVYHGVFQGGYDGIISPLVIPFTE